MLTNHPTSHMADMNPQPPGFVIGSLCWALAPSGPHRFSPCPWYLPVGPWLLFPRSCWLTCSRALAGAHPFTRSPLQLPTTFVSLPRSCWLTCSCVLAGAHLFTLPLATAHYVCPVPQELLVDVFTRADRLGEADEFAHAYSSSKLHAVRWQK